MSWTIESSFVHLNDIEGHQESEESLQAKRVIKRVSKVHEDHHSTHSIISSLIFCYRILNSSSQVPLDTLQTELAIFLRSASGMHLQSRSTSLSSSSLLN